MAKATIPAKVHAELNRQVSQELAAAHGYHAAAIWSEARNLRGCAEFFHKQADEERKHAAKIIKHLIDRGAEVELAAVPAPKQDFDSLLSLALNVQAMEKANTAGIHSVYEAALAAKDYPGQVLMHWFINEQVEEEKWSAEFVQRVQAASCAGSLAALDRHLMDFLVEDEAGKS